MSRPACARPADVFADALSGALSGRPLHDFGPPTPPSPFVEIHRRDVRVPAEGWKLHVSSDVRNAPELAREVLPIALDARAHLKIVASSAQVRALNHGEMGIGQIGKVLTIYPEDEGVFGALAAAIHEAWRPIRFPPVQSDHQLRPGSPVFCREGAFVGRDEPSGRTTVGRPPPVPGLEGSWEAPGPGLGAIGATTIDGRWFARVVLLRHSAKGVLHLAMDDALRTAMVKTARVGACEDASGYDAADRLGREACFLAAARRANVACPEVLAFSTDPVPALALRDCTGRCLDALGRRDSLAAIVKAADNLALLHDAGIAHRDLTPHNILYHDGTVTLIDFELAAYLGEVPPFGGCPVYVAPEANAGRTGTGQDVYSLGATAGAIVLMARGVEAPRSREGMLTGLGLLSEHRVAAAVAYATEADPRRRCSLAGLREMIGSILEAPGHPFPA